MISFQAALSQAHLSRQLFTSSISYRRFSAMARTREAGTFRHYKQNVRQQVCGFLLCLRSKPFRIKASSFRRIRLPCVDNNMQISRDDFDKQRFHTMPIKARLADNERLNQFIKTFNNKISSRVGLVQAS